MVEWVPIEGFPKYSLNRLGQVRHNRSDRTLQPQVNQVGVPFVMLMKENDKHYSRSLPLLILKTLDPNEGPDDPFDTPINLDGNRMNCELDNLMWRPRWFAIQYHQQFKDPFHTPINAPLRAIDEEEVHSCSLDVAKRYGLLERDVVLSVVNRTYVWPTYQVFEVLDGYLPELS